MRLLDFAPRPAHLKWLLDSDPAIRWQVMSDLTAESPEAIAAERSRVATQGWGAQLLARRHQNGRWPLHLLHPEPIPLEMETAVGSASRWNTLRALRVLRWYQDASR